jgi:hypothetical protein
VARIQARQRDWAVPWVRPGARCAAVSHPLAYVTGKKGEQRRLPGGSRASVKEERRKGGGPSWDEVLGWSGPAPKVKEVQRFTG